MEGIKIPLNISAKASKHIRVSSSPTRKKCIIHYWCLPVRLWRHFGSVINIEWIIIQNVQNVQSLKLKERISFVWLICPCLWGAGEQCQQVLRTSTVCKAISVNHCPRKDKLEETYFTLQIVTIFIVLHEDCMVSLTGKIIIMPNSELWLNLLWLVLFL